MLQAMLHQTLKQTPKQDLKQKSTPLTKYILLTEKHILTHVWRRKRLHPPSPRKERVLQAIGNLAKSIVPTPESRATPTPRQTQNSSNSANISSAQTAASPSKNAGTALFKGGSARTPAAVLRSAIALDSPSATDAALEAYLPPSVRSWIRATEIRQEWEKLPKFRQYSPEPQYPPALPQDQQAQALKAVQATLSTVNGNECRKLLAEMKYLTRQKAESTEDIAAQIEIYARRLEAYPADVVRYVIKTQTDSSPWWPAWSELKARLDPLVAARKRKLTALTAKGAA